ncbi:MAG: glutamate synthase large subunit [Deltaproteobacteria bacterium]|nr:MAG: glutamate synthase large subunit [Deltaproteobacteria bacterium]
MFHVPNPPPRQGLYDPSFEHDNCGVGFVASLTGTPSYGIVEQGLLGLRRLEHRGAAGADARTGDGSGLLIQVPDRHLRRETAALGFELPAPGTWAVGMLFLPRHPERRIVCEGLMERVARESGLGLLGWRDVPTDDRPLGVLAREVQPFVRQIFLSAPPEMLDAEGWSDAFERRLYLVRRRWEGEAATLGLAGFYVASLSSRTLVFKGRLRADQLGEFYTDLQRPDVESAVALVHERYSTNTFPTWDLAQPFRLLAHNGEINTLRGNVNWMRARERALRSPVYGQELENLLPVLQPNGSDSATLDNALEFLVMNGYGLEHALMMLVPEAWENHAELDPSLRSFYEVHATFMEPWDGPAALMLTDGRKVAAVLDRNGLRPARFVVTRDDRVIMASEAGVLDVPDRDVVRKGRLEPGRMFLLDLEEGRILDDCAVKDAVCHSRDYAGWLERHRYHLRDLPEPPREQRPDLPTVRLRQRVFGYTREDLEMVLRPMAEGGHEPVGSMGDDTPIAALSDGPLNFFTHFRQLFAQVTNPPIDPIRESLVMSLGTWIGGQENLLSPEPEPRDALYLPQPILTNRELEQLRHIRSGTLVATTLPSVFSVAQGAEGLEVALRNLCDAALRSIDAGYTLLVLSDRSVNAAFAPIPALLAVGAVHHHLVRAGRRNRVDVVIETGEAREVAHHALLIGYGASAVNPYLAFESIEAMIDRGELDGELRPEQGVEHYIRACRKGLLKILSKMGISTIRSYHGAQIFEALGLDPELVDRCFEGTPSRIGGLRLEDIGERVALRHQRVCTLDPERPASLTPGGVYHYRVGGERHQLAPEPIAALRRAATQGHRESYEAFAARSNDPWEGAPTLRNLMRLRSAPAPLPIEEVESVADIVRRFHTGAMSLGAISASAHEALAMAMNRIGGKSNTGEGGEDPIRYTPRPDGTDARSAIKQIASGRFGVTSHYLVNADEIQIKMAQGAKPGEGGQLPGHKVSEVIARVRHSTPGVTLISPPPHHDIYSIEDLSQLIFDLKNVNPRARISVKLVSEVGVGTVAAGVAKAKADVILIAGHSGGTGASPLSSIRHAGIPWEIGLAEAHQVLVRNDLRGRVVLQTDGKMRTGRDVLVAALLGAEEFGFSTMPLIALGCIMMRKCHLNTCPVGIATQNPELERRFAGHPDHVVRYLFFVAEELRQLMSSLGIARVDDLIGRSDLLEPMAEHPHIRERRLDFSAILDRPLVPSRVAVRCAMDRVHTVDQRVDPWLIEQAGPAIERQEPVEIHIAVQNTDRAIGTRLSGFIAERCGAAGLPADTITCRLHGSAGQSFGAFLSPGVVLDLEGEANDYVGKGMSGGRLVVRPTADAPFAPEENVIIGNTALYGATAGEAFIHGLAGERFAVRNSGATAVVEGVGDHGCEYMTGGRVVILGRFGRNFAAGMSGGIAWVHDPEGLLERRCNTELVELGPVEEPDELRAIVARHHLFTGSTTAAAMLEDWAAAVRRFVRVIPTEYRRILALRAESLAATAARTQEVTHG